ncbi:MAG TPA: glycine zipper domain-containing protein [Pirellulaceae bacterium]|nr:glycine zipper domain-containing protein [Pirellulaceae bacterium]
MPRLLFSFALVSVAALVGCRSPYYADRGAAVGGLTGAGAGALIGANNGHAAEGAILGAAVGAISGAVIGDTIDADVARNNAEIQARMGRQMVGAATPNDVIAMSQAGLSEEVIATHIRANGMAQRPQAGDLISLKNQGVSDRVIQMMQTAPPPGGVQAAPVPVYAQPAYAGPPVIVEEHFYGPPPPHWHRHHYHRPPRPVGWSVGFSNH